jgi:MoxR-like ATPase
MDRFALRFELGYVTAQLEVDILNTHGGESPLVNLREVASGDDLARVRGASQAVAVSDEIKRYIVELVHATRTAAHVRIGASPRASLALMKCAQALALIDGDDFVSPYHVQELAMPAIAHRLILDNEARFLGVSEAAVVRTVLQQVPVPS